MNVLRTIPRTRIRTRIFSNSLLRIQLRPSLVYEYQFPASSSLLQLSISTSSSSLISRLTVTSKKNNRTYSQSSKMAEVQGQHGHSAACCSIPPIVAKGYQEKGRYETIGGLKTCKLPPLALLPSFYISILPLPGGRC